MNDHVSRQNSRICAQKRLRTCARLPRKLVCVVSQCMVLKKMSRQIFTWVCNNCLSSHKLTAFNKKKKKEEEKEEEEKKKKKKKKTEEEKKEKEKKEKEKEKK